MALARAVRRLSMTGSGKFVRKAKSFAKAPPGERVDRSSAMWRRQCLGRATPHVNSLGKPTPFLGHLPAVFDLRRCVLTGIPPCCAQIVSARARRWHRSRTSAGTGCVRLDARDQLTVRRLCSAAFRGGCPCGRCTLGATYLLPRDLTRDLAYTG